MTAPRRSSSSTAPSTYRTCARRRCWSNPMVSLQLWLSLPRFPFCLFPTTLFLLLKNLKDFNQVWWMVEAMGQEANDWFLGNKSGYMSTFGDNHLKGILVLIQIQIQVYPWRRYRLSRFLIIRDRIERQSWLRFIVEGVNTRPGSAKSIRAPVYPWEKGDCLETGDGAWKLRDLRAISLISLLFR